MIQPGAGSFRFAPHPCAPAVMTVWTYRPARFRRDGRVLIVMHGATRSGRPYRDAWIAAAEEYGVLIVAPEFSRALFPTPREFEVGNMRDRDRRPLPPKQWAYGIVERLYDEVSTRLDRPRGSYHLFGHSAGAQFVHRMLTFASDCRIEAAVAANAGCYTLLDPDMRFPYGLGGMPLCRRALVRALARRMTLLLGERDCDPDAPLLLKSPEAMHQGPHRLARGRFYHRHAAETARELGVPLAWNLVTMPGIGHSHRALAAPAAEILFGGG